MGNLLGADRPQAAKHCAWLCVALGAGFMGVIAILLASCRNVIGYAFTDDEEVGWPL